MCRNSLTSLKSYLFGYEMGFHKRSRLHCTAYSICNTVLGGLRSNIMISELKSRPAPFYKISSLLIILAAELSLHNGCIFPPPLYNYIRFALLVMDATFASLTFLKYSYNKVK